MSPDGDFVVAIDLGGTKTAVATADLGGRILAHTRLQTEADLGGEQAVERALAEARACLARTDHETGGRCVAAGAGGAAGSPPTSAASRTRRAPPTGGRRSRSWWGDGRSGSGRAGCWVAGSPPPTCSRRPTCVRASWSTRRWPSWRSTSPTWP